MHEQLESGLYAPVSRSEEESLAHELVYSPMMQYLMSNVFNAWVVDEENYKVAWHSPVYAQLALVQDLTMQGVTLIQRAKGVPQSEGWAVTSMLVRGISLARLSCLSLAIGSFSDAFANYRMLMDRGMVLSYLESHNQYKAYAQSFYANIYHQAGDLLNNGQLRQDYPPAVADESKRIMAYLRKTHFGGKAPHKPGHYWKPPHTDSLAEEYAKVIAMNLEGGTHTKVMRVYDLGNKSVHPRLMDMIQPESSDISAEDLRGFILATLVALATFGLSLFPESAQLADKVQEIFNGPPSGTS